MSYVLADLHVKLLALGVHSELALNLNRICAWLWLGLPSRAHILVLQEYRKS